MRNRKEIIIQYLKYSLFQTFLFTSIYGLTNYLSERHLYSFKFYFPFELNIPFIPEMIVIYLSLNLLMLTPIFFMSLGDLKVLNQSMTFVTIIAGIIFLIFPAPCGFTRVEVNGFLGTLFKNLYSLDKTGNTLPSLHIAYSFLFVRILALRNNGASKIFYAWFILIALSVLFTHQHHLLDIFAGITLGHLGLKRYL